MIELYLKGDDICSFQAKDIELLKKDVADYVYYNGEKDIIRIEQVDDMGDVIREFSWREVNDFQTEAETLAEEKRGSDQHFLGAIEAAKEALSIGNFGINYN